jgi:putative transposase
MTPHGWRSRGYLPHCDERGLVQHIVFGLYDALPEQAPDSMSRADERAAWADQALDQGLGSRLLGKAENASIVQSSLLHDDGSKYALAAWCIMPTHVHALVELRFDAALADIIQTWKSATAHAINKSEARKGQLWRREYFDRFYAVGRPVHDDCRIYREQSSSGWIMRSVSGLDLLLRTLAAKPLNSDRRRPRRQCWFVLCRRRWLWHRMPAGAPAVRT